MEDNFDFASTIFDPIADSPNLTATTDYSWGYYGSYEPYLKNPTPGVNSPAFGSYLCVTDGAGALSLTYNNPGPIVNGIIPRANLGFSNELGQNMAYYENLRTGDSVSCSGYVGSTISFRGSTYDTPGYYGFLLLHTYS